MDVVSFDCALLDLANATIYQTLLIRWNTRLVLDLGLDNVNCVGGVNVQRNSFVIAGATYIIDDDCNPHCSGGIRLMRLTRGVGDNDVGLSFSEIERSRIEDLFLSSKFLIFFQTWETLENQESIRALGPGDWTLNSPVHPRPPHIHPTRRIIAFVRVERVGYLG